MHGTASDLLDGEARITIKRRVKKSKSGKKKSSKKSSKISKKKLSKIDGIEAGESVEKGVDSADTGTVLVDYGVVFEDKVKKSKHKSAVNKMKRKKKMK
ncbi:hypothetical protein ADUPG1_005665, partial [Aduncisulcus paluster]